jgi:hypothetical protein
MVINEDGVNCIQLMTAPALTHHPGVERREYIILPLSFEEKCPRRRWGGADGYMLMNVKVDQTALPLAPLLLLSYFEGRERLGSLPWKK